MDVFRHFSLEIITAVLNIGYGMYVLFMITALEQMACHLPSRLYFMSVPILVPKRSFWLY